MKIKDIKLRIILDSRGKETIEAKVIDDHGNFSITSVPSGTSRSEYEALPFPNNDPQEGLKVFETYKSKLVGIDAEDQEAVDSTLHEIDGTTNFSKIGGNISTGISVSVAKLAAFESNLELYQYIYERYTRKMGISKKIPGLAGNVIGGGVHSNNKMSIQEVLLVTGDKDTIENAKTNIKIHASIGEYLKSKNLAIGLNIENAWNTKLSDTEAIETASEFAGRESPNTRIGVDFAASEFFNRRKYKFVESIESKKKKAISREQYISVVENIAQKYNLAYIEDPLDSNDFEGFAEITKQIGSKALIVGDDLYATNRERLQEGIKVNATNAILIKVNQVGTLSDVLDTIELAHSKGIKTVVSHRSGETTDAFMSHLAVAFGSEYIKCGIIRGERIVKINELAKIEAIEKEQ